MDSQEAEVEKAKIELARLRFELDKQLTMYKMNKEQEDRNVQRSKEQTNESLRNFIELKKFEALYPPMSATTKPIVNTDNNTRIQVRSTQTAGDVVPDANWKIVYDTGGIPKPIIVNNVVLATPENMAINIGLSVSTDPNPNPTITFAIVNQPTNGTLSAITNNMVTYTPKQDFQGIDTFTYSASDQTGLTSKPGTVSITVGTPPANVMGIMAVINFSKNVSDGTVQGWMAAVQQQANNDVAPIWGGTVNMVFLPNTQTPPTGYWVMGIFDNTDQAGALGYHEVGSNGEPLGKIFVETSAQAKIDPATVFSHETIEMIGDPNTNTIVKNCLTSSGQTCEMFQELCDPVEDNSYQINGVNVSDFVTKTWFQQNSTGPWDKLSLTTKSFQLLSGGYMEYSLDGRTWTQEVQAMKGKMSMYREMIGENSRWAKYKKPMSERKRSTYKTA